MAVYIDSNIAGDPGMLENLFQQIIVDLKSSFPIWEDFLSKASKLHTVLRSAIGAVATFLESMQKVADMALGTRGATSDLGSALTRLCLRQKGLEDKLKSFVSSIMDCLVNPLQDRMDEWRKMVTLLDKDHAKESKRVHQEMKKAYAETVSLKKKTRKGKPGAGAQLEQAVADYKEKYEVLEALERNSVKMALIEERSRFCHFINCINPVMDRQLAMLSEMTHISEIINYLQIQSLQPCFGPNQCYQVQEWRKTNSPERMAALSSPASPSVSRGSSKSNQSGSSGDGCCSSPKSVPAAASNYQQQCSRVSGRQLSNDSSNGTGDQQEFDQFMPNHTYGLEWTDQQSNQTYPASTKTSVTNLSAQRADHCAACCQQCQSYQSPVKKVVNSQTSVPTTSAVPTTEVTNTETSTTETPSDKIQEVSENSVTGYVNMNQLANLAVQQCEFPEKTDKPAESNNAVDDRHKDTKADGAEIPAQKVDENDNLAKLLKESQKSVGVSESSYGRSRTTEDIAANRASLSNKSRDLSLPPTFRKPFRSGGAPIFGGSPRLFPSANRGHSQLQAIALPEIRQARGRMVRIPSAESPPPPPLPEDYQTCTELVLESDYLPLPPPPVAPQSNGSAVNWSRQLQFSTIPEVSLPSGETGTVKNLPPSFHISTEHAASSEGVGNKDSVVEEAANTFADCIRRGVSLRSTLTDDRSAPRLPSN